MDSPCQRYNRRTGIALTHQSTNNFNFSFFRMLKGDVGREFFMIALGSVEIVEKHTQTIVTNLAEGSFFGEIALLTKCRRSHSVIAKTLSELNVLSKEDFSEIVKDYPRLLKNAWLAAKKRQRDQINRNKKFRQASVNAAGTPADVNLV